MGIASEEIVKAFEQIDRRRQGEIEREESDAFDESVEAMYSGIVQTAKLSIKDIAHRIVSRHEQNVEEAVLGFLALMEGRMRFDMESADGKPVILEFGRYYRRLQSIEEVSVYLESVGKILARERKAIEELSCRDVSDAFRIATSWLIDQLKLLGNIKVESSELSAGVNSDGKELIADEKASLREDEASLYGHIDGLLDDSFAECANPDIQLEQKLAEVDTRIDAIDEEVESALEKVNALLAKNAAEVSGKSLALEGLEPFAGKVESSFDGDAELLLSLHVELMKSFSTYSQVVRDNGLFAAFPNGVSCSVFFSNFQNRGHRLEVPEQVKQKPGGDDVGTTIDRMREFNATPYFGIMDDNYQEHIIAFWYGFAKLAEFLEGSTKLDLAEYHSYMDDLKALLSIRSRQLGMLMDDAQDDAYCDAIDDLEQTILDE